MEISTRTRAVGVTVGVLALALSTGLTRAQEPSASRSARAVAPTAKRPGDPSRRVPTFFGQIGLTPEQRESIYQIRGKHQARIDDLERQVAETQAQMLAECEGVLTDTQKQLLAQRRKAAGGGASAEGSKADKDQSRSGN